MTTGFIAIATALLIYASVGFVVAVAWKRNDIADVMWGPGVFIAAATALVASGQSMRLGPLAYGICGAIFIWAARLAWQTGNRFRSRSGEDPRYAGWRVSWRLFHLRSYFQIFLLQGLLTMSVAMVAIAATMYEDGAEHRLAAVVVGTLVFGMGLAFEAIADLQLNAFLAKRSDKNGILTSGLWRYSRHPNYFGEVAAWWGLWIVATAPAIEHPSILNVSISLLAAVSPATITILILMVSGIPMVEARYVGHKDFDAYKKRTSAFFPWFVGRPDRPSVNSA